jgi:preprotein translocase subunit SecD
VRSRDLYWLLFIVLLTGLALWISFAPNNTFLSRDVSTRLGLDLQGGIQVVLRAENPEAITGEEMQTAAGVIERRVNALGVGETVVQRAGEDSIIVELPGVEDPEQAIETLRGTGRLEFVDPRTQPGGFPPPPGTLVRTTGAPEIPDSILIETAGITQTDTITDTEQVLTAVGVQPPPGEPPYESITEGADLDTNQVQPTTSTQGVTTEPAVSFAFTGDSASSLAQFSQQNIGQSMCIVLDHEVVSCPVIQSALVDGSGIITTSSPEEQEQIFNQLKYGALPVALQVETSRSVSATLGEESLQASFVAGIIGLSMVALFMILYYRLPGLLAVVALLIYTALNFALYRLIPITLTLPGIAGFILSIGLAVDANVLIFARLKEELRRKKELRVAVELGFNEAWSAIRDSSVSTLITSAILWLFGNSLGVSLIKGFAFTLGLGIILSLFTAVVMTRTFLRLIVPLNPSLWFFEIDHRVETPLETPSEPEAA